MQKKVLIITHSQDNLCVERVIDAIERSGAEAYRFQSDQYPVFVQIIATIDEHGKVQRKLISPEFELDLEQISAIWYRRLRVGSNLEQYMQQEYIGATLQEANSTLRGTLDSMDVFQLDYYMKHRIAANKFQQLKLAQSIGMKIPPTLLTNQLSSAKAFYEQQHQNAIVKMQSSFAIYDDRGQEQVVFTNKVTPELLEEQGEQPLQLCPMQFQSNIIKKRELRITVVSDQLFVAAIDSQKMDSAKYDWRKEGRNLLKDWYPCEIPQKLKQQILQLMDIYQLNYGAFDFIETPEGELIFLEVNAGGEFCWLDDLFNQGISTAIADTLLGLLPQRRMRFPKFT